jgi:hypothetical protein
MSNQELILKVKRLKEEAAKREQEFLGSNHVAWHRAQAAQVAYGNVLELLEKP